MIEAGAGTSGAQRQEELGESRIWLTEDSFPVTEDSVALAAFATLRGGERICDLGCGAGTLLLLLAQRELAASLTGVELNAQQATLARRNLAENGLEGDIVTGPLQQAALALPAGGYDLVISNPPYFPVGRGKEARAGRKLQRGEAECTLADVCTAAGRLLKNGGRFAFCARPERMAEWFWSLREAGLEPKRLQLVQGRWDVPAKLMLAEAVKQGGPGLQVLPVAVRRKT